MRKGSFGLVRTHCVHGHALVNGNIYTTISPKNGRVYKRCRACALEAVGPRNRKAWATMTPEGRRKHNARAIAWHQRNPKWVALKGILRKFKLTLDEYHAMQERQDFVCFLCGDEGVLCVDHHHRTGTIRKLLCRACNTGIGAFKESPALLRLAANYCEV